MGDRSERSEPVNMLVPYYIMMSYRYYVKDDPIVSDSLFDKTAKRILNEWENITHYHKDYLNKDMLEAGTYLGEYPTRVKFAVQALRGKDG